MVQQCTKHVSYVSLFDATQKLYSFIRRHVVASVGVLAMEDEPKNNALGSPPSNSHDQDYCIFAKGSLKTINLHLPLLLGGG